MEYKLNEEEIRSCISYGIDAYENDIHVKSIPDISPCRCDMEELIQLLNQLEVELCHLDCIIEDYLTDFSI